MNARHRFKRFAIRPTVLFFLGLLLIGPWTVNVLPVTGVTSAREGRGKPASKYPLQVLILRHAEKPDDDSDPHLTSRGAGRAAALPSLFLAPPTFPTKPAPFPTPDFLFAAKESKNSNRPFETVTPLGKALAGMHIHNKHKDEDFQALVNELFDEAKYAGKTSLICWHHGKIPKLTLAILARAKNGDEVKDQVPKHWDDTIFDRVWHLTFDQQGKAEFANRPQRLLFGDQAK